MLHFSVLPVGLNLAKLTLQPHLKDKKGIIAVEGNTHRSSQQVLSEKNLCKDRQTDRHPT